MTGSPGPLAGVRVVEFAGIGPSPFAAMQLAQAGAEVLRIERAGHADYLPIPEKFDFLNRGKARLALDLKSDEGRARALDIIAGADIVIEGYRPGVMERLGLGPEACLARHPALVYGRMTGWGQDGPYANEAGHDINYISVTGALAAIGPRGGPPVPPLNLVGDFAGGIYLCFGVAAALIAARGTGKGRVVDAAMVDSAAHLMTFLYGLQQAGLWTLQRGDNEADGGFPFYGVYQTRDGGYVAIAAAEMKFRRALLEGMGLDQGLAKQAIDRAAWPEVRQRLAEAFLTRDRDEWCRLMAGRDACLSPVLDMSEAEKNPHVEARRIFLRDAEDIVRPAPAPRFSAGNEEADAMTAEALLAKWGLGA